MSQTGTIARMLLGKGSVSRPEAAKVYILELKGRIRSLGRMLTREPSLNLGDPGFPILNIGSVDGQPDKNGKRYGTYRLAPGWRKKLVKLCAEKGW